MSRPPYPHPRADAVALLSGGSATEKRLDEPLTVSGCAVLLTAWPQGPRRDGLERPPKLLPDGLVQAHRAIAQARLQKTFLGLGN